MKLNRFRVLSKITLIAAAIVMIMGVTACMGIRFESDESIRDEMLEFLSNKYNGQEFTARALERDYSDTLYCYVQGGDPIADRVEVVRKGKGRVKEYRDTYFGILIREYAEDDVLSMCSDIEIPMQAFYATHYYYDNMWDYTKNYADFKEWINDGNPWRFNIAIVISIENIEDREYYAEQVYTKLTEAGYKGLLAVLAVSDIDVYNKITRENLDELSYQYGNSFKTYTYCVN
jgi:hypothetical protein